MPQKPVKKSNPYLVIGLSSRRQYMLLAMTMMQYLPRGSLRFAYRHNRWYLRIPNTKLATGMFVAFLAGKRMGYMMGGYTPGIDWSKTVPAAPKKIKE